MTIGQVLGLGLLLAVILPAVLLFSAAAWIRQRWRVYRVRRYMRQVHEAAYRERPIRGGRDAA
jgi:hypothetical protein